MKKGFLFLIFITIFISCKKENDNEVTNLKNEISGIWELEQYMCSLCINPVINYSPGNQNLILLSVDGSFERKIHDTLLFKGNYTIQRNKECNQSSGDMALIISDGPNPTPQFIQIVADKLILSTPYCYQDGAKSTYRRIK
jgi:hypothetical protein